MRNFESGRHHEVVANATAHGLWLIGNKTYNLMYHTLPIGVIV